jgi:hypothetical protein
MSIQNRMMALIASMGAAYSPWSRGDVLRAPPLVIPSFTASGTALPRTRWRKLRQRHHQQRVKPHAKERAKLRRARG